MNVELILFYKKNVLFLELYMFSSTFYYRLDIIGLRYIILGTSNAIAPPPHTKRVLYAISLLQSTSLGNLTHMPRCQRSFICFVAFSPLREPSPPLSFRMTLSLSLSRTADHIYCLYSDFELRMPRYLNFL